MRPSPRLARPRRAVAVALLAVGAMVAAAVPASAHVEITPESAAKGSFSMFGFSVPNEKDNASTVKVEVTFPTDTPIASVSVLPLAGWTWTAEKTKVATPIKTDDGTVTEAVSKITWTGGEIKPGEFQLFTVSAGPLPTKGKEVVFKAVQTYSDGSVVRWIESTPKGGPEPEFPAPVLTLTRRARGG